MSDSNDTFNRLDGASAPAQPPAADELLHTAAREVAEGPPAPAGAPPVAPAPDPEPEHAVAPAADGAPASGEKGAKRSVLQKELSFRRKGKAPKEPRVARRKAPRAKRAHAFGQKRIVGLKVGASQIAAATVVNNGFPHLVQVARADLEPGVVVGGELRDPQALAMALKTFFKKHKLPTRNVRLGIATNRIGVRTFDLPAVADQKQLANAIRFRAQEALPIPVEQALLDYRVLSERADGDAPQRVLLAVTYRELVERYASACRGAGIQLVGIDLEAFALLRSLAAPRELDDRPDAAFVAVAVGHERSTLAVSDGRVCEFTRVIEWGGASLNAEVGRTLDVQASAADPIKRLVSLEEVGAAEGVSEEAVLRARDAIRRQVHAFARELVSSLHFYQNQPGSLGIAEIVLAGGTAHLRGFAAELERLMNVRVRVGDPLGRVKVGKRVKDDEQIGSLAVAIGLGIED